MLAPEAASSDVPAAPAARLPLRALELTMVAWLGYLLVAPTLGFAWIDSWHNEQRAAQILLLTATMAAWLFALGDARLRASMPPLHFSVPYVLVAGVIGAVRARYVEAAFAELSLHLLLLVLVFVAATLFQSGTERMFDALRNSALLLLGVYACGVAVRYVAAIAIREPIGLDVLLLGYVNPRFPSALDALALPLVASLALDERRPTLLRRISVAVLAATWAINLALGTRAVWFAYACVSALLCWALGWRVVGPMIRQLALTALAGLALYLLLFKALPAWSGIGTTLADRSLDKLAWGSNRELLLASSWDAMRAAPWLGLGPMQFAAIPGVWAAHPHNWVLQLATEYGLPALVLALAGIAALFRRAVAQGRQQAPPAALPTLLFCGAIALAYGLVDGNLVMPVSQSAGAIVLGALLGTVKRPTRTWQARPGRATFTLAWLGAAALLTAADLELGRFAVHTLPDAMRAEGEQRYFPTRTLWPRFWSDGFLPIGGERAPVPAKDQRRD